MESVFIPHDWERPPSPMNIGLVEERSDPPIDFRLLDYVSEYDEHLECPICRCPFTDPVSLTGCDHFFCKDCLQQTWSRHPSSDVGSCPTCRGRTEIATGASAATRLIVNMIDELQVKCPRDGCSSILKRGELLDHIKLYCGYTLVDCLSPDCSLQLLRNELADGCTHYSASCIACRSMLLVAELSHHWRTECTDRMIQCETCKEHIAIDELSQHRTQTCSELPLNCPGHEFGCDEIFTASTLSGHTRNCVFAKLTPVLASQRQRLVEQEAAQQQLNRKLELYEEALYNIQQILDPQTENSRTHLHTTSTSDPWQLQQLAGDRQELTQNAPAPFVSPIHHLLSMNENLHSEVSRLSSAIIELDGRQSMHTLNENLRTRDELAYLGGQVASISRQVQWLTSAQLQRPSDAATREYSDTAGAGTGVEAAVQAVASAVRSAARLASSSSISSASTTPLTRRNTNEENRTKL